MAGSWLDSLFGGGDSPTTPTTQGTGGGGWESVASAFLPAVVTSVGSWLTNEGKQSSEDRRWQQTVEENRRIADLNHQRAIEMARLQASLAKGGRGNPDLMQAYAIAQRGQSDMAALRQQAINQAITNLVNSYKG